MYVHIAFVANELVEPTTTSRTVTFFFLLFTLFAYLPNTFCMALPVNLCEVGKYAGCTCNSYFSQFHTVSSRPIEIHYFVTREI